MIGGGSITKSDAEQNKPLHFPYGLKQEKNSKRVKGKIEVFLVPAGEAAH